MKNKILKTMLLSAAMFAVALGCGFASASALPVAAEETTVEESAAVFTPVEVTIPQQTYLTWEETGIDADAIIASAPETLDVSIENGAISLAVSNVSEVSVLFYLGAYVNLTEENGVWSGTVDLTDELIAQGYEVHILTEDNTSYIYMFDEETSSCRLYHIAPRDLLIYANGSYNSYAYTKGDLIITVYYDFGEFNFEEVNANVEGDTIEVKYDVSGSIIGIQVYCNSSWHYYYPETGWSNDEVPAGYEDKDEAWFKEQCPCQIPLSDVGGGEEGLDPIIPPEVVVPNQTYLTWAETGIDADAIIASAPKTLDVSIENGAISLAVSNVRDVSVLFYLGAFVDLTEENGVWSGTVDLTEELIAQGYEVHILTEDNTAYRYMYDEATSSCSLYYVSPKNVIIYTDGSYIEYVYSKDGLIITASYKVGELNVEEVTGYIEGDTIEVEYDVSGSIIRIRVYCNSHWYEYFPETGWSGDEVPAGYEDKDEAWFKEQCPCQIPGVSSDVGGGEEGFGPIVLPEVTVPQQTYLTWAETGIDKEALLASAPKSFGESYENGVFSLKDRGIDEISVVFLADEFWRVMTLQDGVWSVAVDLTDEDLALGYRFYVDVEGVNYTYLWDETTSHYEIYRITSLDYTVYGGINPDDYYSYQKDGFTIETHYDSNGLLAYQYVIKDAVTVGYLAGGAFYDATLKIDGVWYTYFANTGWINDEVPAGYEDRGEAWFKKNYPCQIPGVSSDVGGGEEGLDPIIPPEVTVPQQTYLTWAETGIDVDAIFAATPETLGESYENGVFSVPDRGMDFVEVYLYMDLYLSMTNENGIWSAKINLTDEQIAMGYRIRFNVGTVFYIYDWDDALSICKVYNIFYDINSSSCLYGEGCNIYQSGNLYNTYDYKKDGLRIRTYYDNQTGTMLYQGVQLRSSNGDIIVYYNESGTLFEVNIYIDSWYYYYPTKGWRDDRVPAGYEDKDEAWFMEQCPCQIPLSDVGGGDVGGGEEGFDPIVLPEVTVPNQTYLTWAETGIDKEAILATVPETLGESYENGVVSVPDRGFIAMEVLFYATGEHYYLTTANGVWSVATDLTDEQIAQGMELTVFIDNDGAYVTYSVYENEESCHFIRLTTNDYFISNVEGITSCYIYGNVEVYYHNDGRIYKETTRYLYDSNTVIEVGYNADGSLEEAIISNLEGWYMYYPETGWLNGKVPTGFEDKDEAWFKTNYPCSIPLSDVGGGDVGGGDVGGGEEGLDPIIPPEVTVPQQTYLTWAETGIDVDAIFAATPETLGESYENGVFSVPDRGMDFVEVYLYAGDSYVALEKENGVWSVATDFTDEQIAMGYTISFGVGSTYYIYIWDEELSICKVYNIYRDGYDVYPLDNMLNIYKYRKDDLRISTYYSNQDGALKEQRVQLTNSDTGFLYIVYYNAIGELVAVDVNTDNSWYYYYPETGWNGGEVPAGYEDKDEAWFMEQCPCQIPGVGSDVGGGEEEEKAYYFKILDKNDQSVVIVEPTLLLDEDGDGVYEAITRFEVEAVTLLSIDICDANGVIDMSVNGAMFEQDIGVYDIRCQYKLATGEILISCSEVLPPTYFIEIQDNNTYETLVPRAEMLNPDGDSIYMHEVVLDYTETAYYRVVIFDAEGNYVDFASLFHLSGTWLYKIAFDAEAPMDANIAVETKLASYYFLVHEWPGTKPLSDVTPMLDEDGDGIFEGSITMTFKMPKTVALVICDASGQIFISYGRRFVTEGIGTYEITCRYDTNEEALSVNVEEIIIEEPPVDSSVDSSSDSSDDVDSSVDSSSDSSDDVVDSSSSEDSAEEEKPGNVFTLDCNGSIAGVSMIGLAMLCAAGVLVMKKEEDIDA